MEQCPILQNCAFFNDRMSNMPAVADMYKRQFCKGEYTQCARYQVKQATGKSHPTLMPNQTDMVNEAIAEMRKEG